MTSQALLEGEEATLELVIREPCVGPGGRYSNVHGDVSGPSTFECQYTVL